MELKVFFTVFAAVFVPELGDKTQLATMLFAADRAVSKWTVFLGASAALVVATVIGVIAGTLMSEFINEKYLNYIAGAGFILIGAITLVRAWCSLSLWRLTGCESSIDARAFTLNSSRQSHYFSQCVNL